MSKDLLARLGKKTNPSTKSDLARMSKLKVVEHENMTSENGSIKYVNVNCGFLRI